MIFIFLTIIVTLIFYSIGKSKRRWDIANKIPGPKGIPIFGETKFFTSSMKDLFAYLIKLQNEYDGYYKTWLFTYLWIVVYEPKIVEKILTNPKLIKAQDYEFLKPWLGNGLLVNEGKPWFARRKAITPAFHFKILEDFIESFKRHADILVDKLRNNKIIDDIMPHLTLYAFDVICETAMGLNSNSHSDLKSTYIKAVETICRTVYLRMFNPFLEMDFIFRLTKYYKPYKESLNIAHEITRKIIEQRRQGILQNGQNLKCDFEEKDEFGRRKKMALLDVLLKTSVDGKLLTDDEIREEVDTFMFAGHDTTSKTIGFLLYNIAKYPEVQRKICDEISAIFDGSNDTEITLNALNELKYLDLVIKESMRIYTTVPFIGRQLQEETEIEGILFPENSNVSIWVYGLCHNEKIFPEPEKFIPERFEIENNTEKLNPFAYIPFSAGHRNCIGQKFALYEMKTLVVRILQNFEINLINPNEELELISGIVLSSQNGIHLKFTEKKKQL